MGNQNENPHHITHNTRAARCAQIASDNLEVTYSRAETCAGRERERDA